MSTQASENPFCTICSRHGERPYHETNEHEGRSQFSPLKKVSSRVYPTLERKKGGPDNWVEASGGLPDYIERIAKHLHYERGMPIGRAIATAVSRCKMWAAGGGGVSKETQAKAAKAIAQWEKKKAGIGKKFYSTEQRKKAHTLPDGSFPIEDEQDLRNAITAYGRAKDKAAAKAHIIAQAKRLGATDLLPEGW